MCDERAREDARAPEEVLSAKAYREVYAYLYSKLTNADDAADIAQEVFLRAVRAVRASGPPRNARAWLMRIAQNEASTWFRRAGRADWLKSVMSRRADAPASNATLERVEIERALRKLDDKSREAVVYVHMLGYTYEEAAEMAGVPVTTLVGRVYRGRTRLRELLGAGLDRGKPK
jgi:RNA polymerase sigma-70 factor (ECF subfamily)